MAISKADAISTVADLSASSASALIGAGIGSVVAGPVGAISGALAGTTVEKVLRWIGTEITQRYLSPRENKRIGVVYEYAQKKIEDNLNAGKQLRQDDFFTDDIDDRSAAHEILEATLLVAQKEYEELKLPYLANLYANINFDATIDKYMANQLIKLAENLSFRQLVIMRVIGAYQTGDFNGPPRRDSAFKTINGYDNISIATEIYDLYRRGIVHSDSAILGAAGITPSKLTIGGIGALLYNLMDLPHMAFDKMAERIVMFLITK